ncbi:PqqD family protein [bacterium]|nr:PqqD family protein [bacterium]MBP9810928.1 PqqD family protein [bacterium]
MDNSNSIKKDTKKNTEQNTEKNTQEDTQKNTLEDLMPLNCARLKQLAVSETGFIFDPQSGQSFTVNQTGHLVIEMLKRSESPQAAAQELALRCQKPYELTLCSVEAFMMQLARYL